MILLALWLSGEFGLIMINYILRRAVELGMIALVILFQPELRRLLERVGSSFNRNHNAAGSVINAAIEQTVQACCDMAATKTGALIAFERKVPLGPVIATGTVINADANSELIKNLFFNKAPLHDGAMIIRDGKVHAAGCILPLTKNNNISTDLGTRHRAALGMSENSDAVIVIVSEETGTISIAKNGIITRNYTRETLSMELEDELIPKDTEKNDRIPIINNVMKGKRNERKNK